MATNLTYDDAVAKAFEVVKVEKLRGLVQEFLKDKGINIKLPHVSHTKPYVSHELTFRPSGYGVAYSGRIYIGKSHGSGSSIPSDQLLNELELHYGKGDDANWIYAFILFVGQPVYKVWFGNDTAWTLQILLMIENSVDAVLTIDGVVVS